VLDETLASSSRGVRIAAKMKRMESRFVEGESTMCTHCWKKRRRAAVGERQRRAKTVVRASDETRSNEIKFQCERHGLAGEPRRAIQSIPAELVAKSQDSPSPKWKSGSDSFSQNSAELRNLSQHPPPPPPQPFPECSAESGWCRPKWDSMSASFSSGQFAATRTRRTGLCSSKEDEYHCDMADGHLFHGKIGIAAANCGDLPWSSLTTLAAGTPSRRGRSW